MQAMPFFFFFFSDIAKNFVASEMEDNLSWGSYALLVGSRSECLQDQAMTVSERELVLLYWRREVGVLSATRTHRDKRRARRLLAWSVWRAGRAGDPGLAY